MLEVRSISFGSEAYRASCDLRDEVLRQPLGLKLSVVDTEEDQHQQHWGLYENDHLIGCLIAKPRGEGVVQLRQYSITNERQGEGLGRILMEGVEAELRAQGIRHIWLHAREPVIGFYAKLGYQPVGELFQEVGRPHQIMEKWIAPIT